MPSDARLGIILLGILVALLLAQSGALVRFVIAIGGLRLLGDFIAGILFTSVFSAAPATVLLGELAQANSAWTVALTGALGAVAGDSLIFRLPLSFAANFLGILLIGFAARSIA